jgi:hypothetical protein
MTAGVAFGAGLTQPGDPELEMGKTPDAGRHASRHIKAKGGA